MEENKKLEVIEIISKVRANQGLLKGCVRPHDFNVIEDKKTGLLQNYYCSKCNGIVSRDNAYWYKLGLKHHSENKDG